MLGTLARMVGIGGAAEAPSSLAGTLYAIGDVHGHAAKLEALLKQIRTDAAKQKESVITLVMLGDYINRGPDSAGVLRVLRQGLPKGWQVIFLRGNHEQKLLEFLERPVQQAEWLGWGGVETCLSYGIKPYGNAGLRAPAALAAELQLALQETGDLVWLQATRLHYTALPYMFVHAGVRPGLPLHSQMTEDLLYIREDWLNRPHGLPGVVVFGHTIQNTPLLAADRIGIDTGAYQGGPLTAVRLQAKQPPMILQAR